MRQATVGARITEQGIEFFGTDEVNALIEAGQKVLLIEPGEVIVEEVPEEEGAYAVAGFEMVVTLAEPEA